MMIPCVVRQNLPGGYVKGNNRSTLVLTTVNGLPAKRKCVREHCLASLLLLLLLLSSSSYLPRPLLLLFLLSLSCCTIYCVACTPRKLAFLAYLHNFLSFFSRFCCWREGVLVLSVWRSGGCKVEMCRGGRKI